MIDQLYRFFHVFSLSKTENSKGLCQQLASRYELFLEVWLRRVRRTSQFPETDTLQQLIQSRYRFSVEDPSLPIN